MLWWNSIIVLEEEDNLTTETVCQYRSHPFLYRPCCDEICCSLARRTWSCSLTSSVSHYSNIFFDDFCPSDFTRKVLLADFTSSRFWPGHVAYTKCSRMYSICLSFFNGHYRSQQNEIKNILRVKMRSEKWRISRKTSNYEHFAKDTILRMNSGKIKKNF
jgi:hypothetical protein